MKISQEVREFARLQNTQDMLGANPSPPSGGEGDSAKLSGERGTAEAEAGMAAMSELFKETGSELYMGAGDRERD